jgi:hypothetical protein
MQRVLQESGWPNHIAERRGMKQQQSINQHSSELLMTNQGGNDESVSNGVSSEGGTVPRPMNKVCQICDNQFSKLWVHRGVCCECELLAREGKIQPTSSPSAAAKLSTHTQHQGWCPFNPRCKPQWWCEHDRKCIVCDAHSCATCRLHRGGAEVVLALARQLDSAYQESRIQKLEYAKKIGEEEEEEEEEEVQLLKMKKTKRFHNNDSDDDSDNNDSADASARISKEVKPLALIALDFDRTLATTRSGAQPLVGTHTLDPDLLNILWDFQGRCCIVTRNRHNQEIINFLKDSGAPTNIPVFSLPKKFSKTTARDFRACLDGNRGHIIVVDDTIAELVDKEMMSSELIHRVLFVRALL